MSIPRDLRNYERTTFGAGNGKTLGFPQTIQAQIATDSLSSLRSVEESLQILTAMRIVRRGTTTTTKTIGTTPVSILKAQKGQGYTIINPTPSVGLTIAQTILPSTAIIANGNTQATSIGVASYDSVQLFLNVSGIVGAPTLDVYVQAQDPLSLAWVDTQLVFPLIGALGINYGNLGNNGIGTKLAVRWEYVGAGVAEPITISIGAILKGGLGGSQSGVSNTAYIGAAGVTNVSGWPLLEGQSRDIYVEENSELFAVADNTIDIRVIEW